MNYEVWIDDQEGARLVSPHVVSFDVVKKANNIGAWVLSLAPDFDTDLLAEDRIVEIWRGDAGEAMKLVTIGFIRKILFESLDYGQEVVTISGPDEIEILSSRIVAYASGSSYSDKTDYLDDMMKEIVKENFTTATDTARRISVISVADDHSLAPSRSKAFAWKIVLSVLKEIADASAQAGTLLFYNLVPNVDGTTLKLRFETYIDQMGTDRTQEMGNKSVLFGLEWGNFGDVKLLADYTTEVSYIYAGGKGDGSDRYIYSIGDTARTGISIWNRREAFIDARNDDDADIEIKAKQALEAGSPKMKITGLLKDTDQSKYGRDWEYGDRITAIYHQYQFSALVNEVRINLNPEGKEEITAKLEAIL